MRIFGHEVTTEREPDGALRITAPAKWAGKFVVVTPRGYRIA